MPNTIILPYNVTKQIRVVGKNAANTQERPITNLVVSVNAQISASITITPTADPNIWSVVNHSTTQNAPGSLIANAINEINAAIVGNTPVQLTPPDPATTIEITEV